MMGQKITNFRKLLFSKREEIFNVIPFKRNSKLLQIINFLSFLFLDLKRVSRKKYLMWTIYFKFCMTFSVFRRVRINSESEMPLEFGTTPGGTMFGTTPGGQYTFSLINFLVCLIGLLVYVCSSYVLSAPRQTTNMLPVITSSIFSASWGTI